MVAAERASSKASRYRNVSPGGEALPEHAVAATDLYRF
jgi:hypothetical protein